MREAMASTTLDREQREGGSRGESTADLTGMSGTLLQQSLQLALLKYGFEGALPCGVNQQRHIMGTAGMLKGPAPEEEAAIVSGVCVFVCKLKERECVHVKGECLYL